MKTKTAICRTQSGICFAVSLMLITTGIPGSEYPVFPAILSMLFMSAAFVLWGD